MARVPEAELERLKSEVSVARLVEAKGVVLEKRGKDLVGRCPFHSPDDAFLRRTPSKNLWRCFGACGQTAAVDFVMKAGASPSGTRWSCCARADLSGPVGPRHQRAEAGVPGGRRRRRRQLLGQVRDYYHQTLKASPEALAYLERRGLKSAAAIDTFKLGFANRTLGLRMPDTRRLTGEELRGRLQKLGVMRQSGHEHLAGSLVVPISDEGGAVVGLYGRKVTKALRAGTAEHLYLPGPHRAAFNSAALAGQRTAILCEALLDALSFVAPASAVYRLRRGASPATSRPSSATACATSSSPSTETTPATAWPSC